MPREITYRCPVDAGHPIVGELLMGNGPRVKTAYRVLDARQIHTSRVGLGTWVWRLKVEPMPIAVGRQEIEETRLPHWGLQWDRRQRRVRGEVVDA